MSVLNLLRRKSLSVKVFRVCFQRVEVSCRFVKWVHTKEPTKIELNVVSKNLYVIQHYYLDLFLPYTIYPLFWNKLYMTHIPLKQDKRQYVFLCFHLCSQTGFENLLNSHFRGSLFYGVLQWLPSEVQRVHPYSTKLKPYNKCYF